MNRLIRINEWIDSYVDLIEYDEIEEEEEDPYGQPVFVIDFSGIEKGSDVTLKKMKIEADYDGGELYEDGRLVLSRNRVKDIVETDEPVYAIYHHQTIYFTKFTDKKKLINMINRILSHIKRSISSRLTDRINKFKIVAQQIKELKNGKDITKRITVDTIIGMVDNAIGGYKDHIIDNDRNIFIIRFIRLPRGEDITIDKVDMSERYERYVGSINARMYSGTVRRLLDKPDNPLSTYNKDIYLTDAVNKEQLYDLVKSNLIFYRRSISGKLQNRIKNINRIITEIRTFRKSDNILKNITPENIIDKLRYIK